MLFYLDGLCHVYTWPYYHCHCSVSSAECFTVVYLIYMYVYHCMVDCILAILFFMPRFLCHTLIVFLWWSCAIPLLLDVCLFGSLVLLWLYLSISFVPCSKNGISKYTLAIYSYYYTYTITLYLIYIHSRV